MTDNSDTRATGVEFSWSPELHPDADHELHTVCAKRLVIVSAGSFGSPGVLERSGIGAKHVLEKNKIKQLVDLPGVGENYQGMTLWCRSCRNE
jgi:alcohol oxidase